MDGAVNLWQPIETAPKDGTQILIYVPAKSKCGRKNFVYVAHWFDFSKRWVAGNGYGLKATHWMPLPLSPLGEKVDFPKSQEHPHRCTIIMGDRYIKDIP